MCSQMILCTAQNCVLKRSYAEHRTVYLNYLIHRYRTVFSNDLTHMYRTLFSNNLMHMHRTVFSNDLMQSTEMCSQMILRTAQNSVLKLSYAQV